MYYTNILGIYGSFSTCFSQVFLIFNYWNFDFGIFVLRSSISVQMSRNIFGIINKRGVQISIGGLRKKIALETFFGTQEYHLIIQFPADSKYSENSIPKC